MDHMTVRKRFVLIAMCVNLGIWLWFWGWFFAVSHPFPQPIGALEDRPPRNVVFMREAGVEGSLEPRTVIQTAVLVASLPSWLLAHKVGERAWAAEYGSPTRTHLGTSIGGYVLIGTTALSFFQWYGVALLFAFIRSCLSA